jgi:hypothetical protein
MFVWKKIPNSETLIIDDVNQTEDYISRGTNSLNPEDYSVSFGKKSALEIVKRAKTGIGVIDVHIHPSGLIGVDRIKDILLRTTNEYGNIVDIPLKKYGNTQLIMQSWGTYELQMQDNVREDLSNLKRK